jgi:hypothetical protein
MKDDLFHARRGVAVLSACIVQTMNESDQGFQERFLRRLERASSELRDSGSTIQELELLSWVRELLTGFSLTKGQGKPFLDP